MKLSVVIPTLNEEEYIGNLVKSVKNSNKSIEVIVVDCVSDDQTQKIARDLGAKVIVSPIKGVAHQRNLGAKSAKGEIIIFLDADVSFGEDFIDSLVSQFKKRGLDIACPFFLTNSKNPLVWSLHFLFSFVFFVTQKIIPSGAGPCIITKKDFFLECGGFDESLTFEDVEFIRRAAKNGRYGIINCAIAVSDRRFKNQGVLKMIAIYIAISVLFLFGAFKAANAINYWGENNGHRNTSKHKKS